MSDRRRSTFGNGNDNELKFPSTVRCKRGIANRANRLPTPQIEAPARPRSDPKTLSCVGPQHHVSDGAALGRAFDRNVKFVRRNRATNVSMFKVQQPHVRAVLDRTGIPDGHLKTTVAVPSTELQTGEMRFRMGASRADCDYRSKQHASSSGTHRAHIARSWTVLRAPVGSYRMRWS